MLATSQNSIGAERRKTSGSSRAASVVERVAALVQQRLDVALQAGGVHEDERLADFVQRGLVPAGLLALAAGQVEIVALAAASRNRPPAAATAARRSHCVLLTNPSMSGLRERPQRRAVLADRPPDPTAAASPVPRSVARCAIQFIDQRHARSSRSRRRIAGNPPACSRTACTPSSMYAR